MINLSGIESMNDDPTSVNVLYANVSLKDSSDRYMVQLFGCIISSLEFFFTGCRNLLMQ